MRDSLTIGELTVQPGTRARGFLEATRRPGGESIGIPFMVVHGAEAGPTFTVTAGVHGDEYDGGEAIRRFWRELDPTKVRGTYIGVPEAHLPAFEYGLRDSSIDHVNLNRIFPGNPAGGVTDRIAHTLFTQIILRSDYVIDAHSGGVELTQSPSVNFKETADPALNARILDFARATGLPWLLKGKVGSGQVHDEAPKKGIVGINTELGGEGRCLEQWVEANLTVSRNIMKYLGMIEGAPDIPADQQVLSNKTQLNAGFSGVWINNPAIKADSFVKRGEVIGTVSDVFGEVLETVVAPHDGTFAMLRTFPTIRVGDWIGLLFATAEPAGELRRA